MISGNRAPLPVMLTLVVALVGTVGCGADVENDGPEAARAVVESFGTAFAARDGQRICGTLLAKRLVRQVEALGLPCDVSMTEAAKAVTEPTIAVGEVTVIGGQAYIETTSGARGQRASKDQVELVREDDRWKIVSLGADGGAGVTQTTPGKRAPKVGPPTPIARKR